MNRIDRAALETLERSLPETDPRTTWEPAFLRLKRRRKRLEPVVMTIGGLPIFAGVLFGLFLLIRLLPPEMHFGIRITIGVGGGGASAAMLRALLSSIPGFGWAKELKRLSDTLEPYQRYIDWLDAKEAAA